MQEQASFLQSHMTVYLSYTEAKDYNQFWIKLHKDWFVKWPERAVCLVGIEGPLSTGQEEILRNAIAARKKVSLKTAMGRE